LQDSAGFRAHESWHIAGFCRIQGTWELTHCRIVQDTGYYYQSAGEGFSRIEGTWELTHCRNVQDWGHKAILSVGKCRMLVTIRTSLWLLSRDYPFEKGPFVRRQWTVTDVCVWVRVRCWQSLTADSSLHSRQSNLRVGRPQTSVQITVKNVGGIPMPDRRPLGCVACKDNVPRVLSAAARYPSILHSKSPTIAQLLLLILQFMWQLASKRVFVLIHIALF